MLTATISGVSLAQIGYSVFNQLNSSAFCASGMARVSDWNMWWCVFTRPGSTAWPRASIVSSAVVPGGISPAGQMASICAPRTRKLAPRSSRRSASRVTRTSALVISRVRSGVMQGRDGCAVAGAVARVAAGEEIVRRLKNRTG